MVIRNIDFTGEIFKEDGMFVAYCPELDVSSCGITIDEAKKNLLQATKLFIEESQKMGNLKAILEESGYDTSKNNLQSPMIEIDKLKLNVEVGKN